MQKKMPKISVIIPVYNTEKHLRKCLESVLNQTLKDIEIICIDDCSTDNSLEILKKYQTNDNRIKLFDFTENQGVSIARNEGINHAQGEYIGFVDSDDYIDLDFYEKLYNKTSAQTQVVKGTFNIVSGNYTTISDMNKKIKENITNFFGEFCTAIYKTEFLRKNNLYFPPKISVLEDPLFSIKTAKCIDYIAFDNSANYYYIRHDTSATHTINTNKINEMLKSSRLILNEITNENDYKIVLNSLILYLLFINLFGIKDLSKKERLIEGIKKILELNPQYNIERDYNKLYKQWYTFKMQTMIEQIKSKKNNEPKIIK